MNEGSAVHRDTGAQVDGLDAEAPPERPLHYHEIRDKIQEGDLFFFRGKFRSSRFFTWLTGSFYSHSAIIARWNKRLMILQAEMKVEAIPLSVAVQEYPGRADWYRLKRELIPDIDSKTKKMLWEAICEVGLPFALLDLLRSVARYLFHFRLKDAPSPKGMFCSEYVERSFRKGGMPLVESSDIATFPQDLAECEFVEYLGTIIHHPDHPFNRCADDVE
ncbi:MAG: hypothetical protein BMS9Abin29_2393 [Gemmatimonadota bacterium]|nr:MAG: hypothetical protein BMS9Abin29_2393 [Gemmatimonadota bacterium]